MDRMPDTVRLTTALGDRYVIERELGAGGMATVYLARDVKHDREVALKVLRPELFAVLGAERFLAEIKITARLDHPHILTLIDSGAIDGFLFYVLPYVRGESLRHKLEREKQLGIEEALSITRQIASALDYAHQRGVVHRDIKPENILLHEGEAVLADFGIALAVKEAGGNRLTETGLSLGTPQYMSPEQATGDRALDARSDLYSLAAVLYEMLAGEPPVTGATAQAMIAKLMTERPTRIRAVRDTVPEGIDAAVAKALSKVPADRFASAGQFVQELTAGARPSRQQEAQRPGRRGGGILVVAAIFAIAVLVAVTQSRRGGQVRVIQPDRAQLTFTGNAWVGGLSPDGQRLAFSTRKCTEAGYCNYDVMVQDVGGAGTSTVLSGWASIWEIDWTSDSRYLLVNGFQGTTGTWGPFAVPSLGGGQVRFLGCCDANLGPGDTALVAQRSAGGRQAWVKFVTLADGVVHDSLPVTIRPGGGHSAFPLPHGRLLVKQTWTGGAVISVVERTGRVVDSLVLGSDFNPGEATRDGRVFLANTTPDGTGTYDLLGWAIGDNGRFRARPDTVLRQVHGDYQQAPSGVLLNSDGPTDYEVWLMHRDGPASMRFTQRRLASGTAPLGGVVSFAGDKVLLWRRVPGGHSMSQLSLLPADSGAETLLGPPMELEDYEFNRTGDGLVLAVRAGADSIQLLTMQLPGGRRQPFGAVARADFGGIMALAGGGAVVLNPDNLRYQFVGVPGRRDTTFTVPEHQGTIEDFMPSSDGREMLTTGWDQGYDTVLIRRVSLADGRMTRLAAIYADGSAMPAYQPDGSLLIPIRETGNTTVWYRLPAAGGNLVRMGAPPRAADASYRQSADARTVVARVATKRPDIYIIRNFAELLPR